MNKPTSLLKAALAIVSKDLRTEIRSRETVSAMLLFALLAIFIFSFALELDRSGRQASASGVLWVTVIFAGTLGLGRSINREKDQGSLDGLLLIPADRAALYLGKMIVNFLFILIIAVVMLIPLSLLFDVSFLNPFMALVILAGVLGYAATGTLIASMASFTRGREVLLPVLLLPIALSIIVPAVRATRDLLEGAPFEDIAQPLNLLVVMTVIYVTLGFLLFEFVVEE
jgi:heme exporter protein B